MSSRKQVSLLCKTTLAAAVAGAFGAAQAQEPPPTIAEAAAPSNGTTISVGVGHATGSDRDRARFGMFNGLRDHSTNLLFGFDYRNLDSEEGRSVVLTGRNLTLDNRELNYDYRRFGDMRIRADYTEITRHDPRTINTGMQGVGSTTPTIVSLATPGTGTDYNLELKRKGLGIGLDKWITPELSFEASFRNEDKTGSRLYGRGFACSANWATVGACSAANNTAAAVLLLAEPVNSTHQQAEAKLNWASGKWIISGGYYGSFYKNNYGTLTNSISGGLFNQGFPTPAANPANAGLINTLSLPMALWPDNQAHQFSLAGNYAATQKTRINFKYVYTHATQNENFGAMGLTSAPAGRSSLDGVIDTTKAQVGFASRPFDKLHLHGDLAYFEKKNKTPIDFYNNYFVTTPAVAARAYTNGAMSPKKYEAKLEGSYHISHEYTGVLGVKYESEDFGTWTPTDVAGGTSALRQKLRETGYRAELRRVMSETLNGSIAYERDRRVGMSPWLQPVNFQTTGGRTGVTEVPDAVIYQNGTNPGRAIIPFIFMDRTRDKVRFMANWTPTERIGLQLFVDEGKDTYRGPTEHGLRSFRMSNISLDASYTLTDAWKLTAFSSRGRQTIDSGHSTGYDVIYKDTAYSFGGGVRGTPHERFTVGADLMWIHDRLDYDQKPDPAASATNIAVVNAGGLPDVVYRTARLNLYGQYALNKTSYLRLDFVHFRSYFNEWTYSNNGIPFLYSDNTTVNAQERQVVSFIGASYVFKFQ